MTVALVLMMSGCPDDTNDSDDATSGGGASGAGTGPSAGSSAGGRGGAGHGGTGGSSAGSGGGGELHWFETCGDPVCGVSPDPSDDPNIPNCTTQEAGDSCSSEGEECDGVLSCGASLLCASTDPTMSPGGCPRSRARFKEGIEYLSERQRQDYHAQLMSLPLASYRYKRAEAAGPQLGFIIEDIEPSVAVSGDHVNMYGYLSMAVAAIQVQQEQITSLQRELERLRAELPADTAPSCGP